MNHPATTTPISRRAMLRAFAAIPVAAAVIPRFAFAQDAPLEEPLRGLDFDKAAVDIKALADNLHVLAGPGGNITVLSGPDGAVVIDSGIAPRAADVLGAIKTLGGRGPNTLINTHWHQDHVGGNAGFAAAGVSARLAHENVYTRMKNGGRIEFFAMDVAPAEAAALPTNTFKQEASIKANGTTLNIEHIAPAHTDGDSIIDFPHAKVVVLGDLFFNGLYPFIDYSSGGSLNGMIAAGETLLKNIDASYKLVPGHGPIATRDDYVNFIDMLSNVRERLAPLAERGMSLEEVQKAKVLTDLDEKWGQRLMRGNNFVHLVYPAMLVTKNK